jgi:hypothetical protein
VPPRKDPPNALLDEFAQRLMEEVLFPRMEMMFDKLFPQAAPYALYEAGVPKKKKKRMRVNPAANARPHVRNPPNGYKPHNHPTHYDTLMVTRNADAEVITAAYRKLAFLNHPDRNPGDRSAAARMVNLNAAYAVLSDPHKRQAYDRTL